MESPTNPKQLWVLGPCPGAQKQLLDVFKALFISPCLQGAIDLNSELEIAFVSQDRRHKRAEDKFRNLLGQNSGLFFVNFAAVEHLSKVAWTYPSRGPYLKALIQGFFRQNLERGGFDGGLDMEVLNYVFDHPPGNYNPQEIKLEGQGQLATRKAAKQMRLG